MLHTLLFWWNNFIQKWNIIMYRYMLKNIWSWSWLLYDNDFMMIEIGQVRMKYHVHGMTIGQWMKYLWICNAHFLSFLSHFSSFLTLLSLSLPYFLTLSLSLFRTLSLFLFLPHVFFFLSPIYFSLAFFFKFFIFFLYFFCIFSLTQVTYYLKRERVTLCM